jgi:hypothetical protein
LQKSALEYDKFKTVQEMIDKEQSLEETEEDIKKTEKTMNQWRNQNKRLL